MHRSPGIKQNPKHRQMGLTLVELLVALALGVVLVGGITKVYLENKKNYVQDEELARLQENGRFAMNLLKRELKMSGFLAGTTVGTAPGQLVPGGNITTDCSVGWALDPAFPVDFINDIGIGGNVTSSVAGDNFSACITQANVAEGTDIITIKRVAGMPTIRNAKYASGGTATGEEKKNSFYIKTSELDPLFIYINNGFATDSSDALIAANEISMWLYMAKVFYIRNYSVVVGDNIPTLMMISLQDTDMIETPLIEGVEDFHVEFGLRDECDPNDEVCDQTPVRFTADPDPTSGEISRATVARIYLLMRTRNPIRDYTDTKTYTLGSKAANTPGENFMRRVFTTTIKLRN